jgi:hypothetical protein
MLKDGIKKINIDLKISQSKIKKPKITRVILKIHKKSYIKQIKKIESNR